MKFKSTRPRELRPLRLVLLMRYIMTPSGMSKTMCTEAGIVGNYSLHAYAVTVMYSAGIPEKVNSRQIRTLIH